MPQPPQFRRRDFIRGSGVFAFASMLPAMELVPTLWTPAANTKIAVIGAGRWGRKIAAELHGLEGAQVIAVAEPVASRLRSAKRKAPDALGYASLAEVRAVHPELQAVVVATPSHLHAAIAQEALEAKLHVYCEAPMATTAEDLRLIQAAAATSGSVFACGLMARSNPLYAHARDFVRSGTIRDSVGYAAHHHEKNRWVSPARDPKDEAALNWRLDEKVSLGLAGEFGVHQFDVFHWFLGQYPLAVRGRGSIQFYRDGRKVHDTIGLELEFPDERYLHYDATLANSFGKRHEVFYGSAGAIKMAQDAGWLFKESDAPTLGFEVYAGREHFHDEEGITLVADATKLAAQERLKEGVGLQEPPLRFALKAFLNSVQEGGEIACSATEGARAAYVAIAANQALLSGERVLLDPALFTDG
jgi:predicted dehydrogenase